MTALTMVSAFAGVGGFDLAAGRAGIEVVASIEIDKAATQVLKQHWPNTPVFPDICEVTPDELRAAGFVPERGIFSGGFPCQDLSIAGRRAGLGGARSGLFFEIVRLADALRPRWLVLENVPGLLSAVCTCPGDETCINNGRSAECGSWDIVRRQRVWLDHVAHMPDGGACAGGCLETHGGAMGTVLGALGELGYGFAYRVLDAQFFGVPQRRRRVFIVASLGDWAAPVEVLLEPEGGERDSAAGESSRPKVAGHVAASAGTPSGAGIDTHTHTHTQELRRRLDSSGWREPGIPDRRRSGSRRPSHRREAVAALTANGVGTCGPDDNQAQAGHIVVQVIGGGK